MVLYLETLTCECGCAVFLLQLANSTQQPLDGFMIQFNKNAHGVAPASQVVQVPPLGPVETAGASVPLTTNPALINPAANPSIIQV